MATSVASVWSVRDRSASPITRLYRPIDVSTLARRLYPLAFCHADAAPFGGHPQVTVALCRGALGRGTHNRACPWRHDDDSVWMTLGNRLADPVLIVIAVGGEGSDAIGYLVEKRANQRTIIDFFLGHFDGDDLAAVGIDTNSGRPPPRRPGCLGAVLHAPAGPVSDP